MNKAFRVFEKAANALQMLPVLIRGIESLFGRGNGKTKKEKVMELFKSTVDWFEDVSDVDVIDMKEFLEAKKDLEEAIEKVNNAVVRGYNATKVFGKSLE